MFGVAMAIESLTVQLMSDMVIFCHAYGQTINACVTDKSINIHSAILHKMFNFCTRDMILKLYLPISQGSTATYLRCDEKHYSACSIFHILF